MSQQFSHRNGENSKPDGNHDGYYWIKGEAIIREKMWPYEHRQRVVFHEEQIPYLIHGNSIDMGCDVEIPVEWVTKKSQFWGASYLCEALEQ